MPPVQASPPPCGLLRYYWRWQRASAMFNIAGDDETAFPDDLHDRGPAGAAMVALRQVFRSLGQTEPVFEQLGAGRAVFTAQWVGAAPGRRKTQA